MEEKVHLDLISSLLYRVKKLLYLIALLIGMKFNFTLVATYIEI